MNYQHILTFSVIGDQVYSTLTQEEKNSYVTLPESTETEIADFDYLNPIQEVQKDTEVSAVAEQPAVEPEVAPVIEPTPVVTSPQVSVEVGPTPADAQPQSEGVPTTEETATATEPATELTAEPTAAQ